MTTKQLEWGGVPYIEPTMQLSIGKFENMTGVVISLPIEKTLKNKLKLWLFNLIPTFKAEWLK